MNFLAPYQVAATGKLALHFHPRHLADLRASGLMDETICSAGIYSLRPCDISLFFNRVVPEAVESALCFPYAGGRFARIKLFPSLGKMKYAQPPKSGAHLYMPFPIAPGALVITEGEKKCLAAHQAGLNAVAIGGVWAWLQHGETIDDLHAIAWNDREVTMIPDSDVFMRPDLLRAIFALAREIQALGAVVYVAQIPQPAAAKVGLDDFLVCGGKVEQLEVFALSHRIFKSVRYWHSKWKFKNAIAA